MLNGKSNTPPSTTASHSALPQGRLCGLDKGEEVKTEDNPLTPFDKGDLYNALDFYYRQSWNKDLEDTRRCDTDIVICV